MYFRLIWRLFFFSVLTTAIVLEIYLRKRLFRASLPTLMRVRRRWARQLLRGVGVRLTSEGDFPSGAGMVVANHRSYLDPILFIAEMDAVPLCMAEVRSWPIVGWGADMSGVLFVDRADPAHRTAMVRAMIQKSNEGFPVLIFPEGTTSAEQGTLPFQMGAFQIAARCKLKVAPVVYIFDDPADFWVGDESFLSHAWRRFRVKQTHIRVVYGPLLERDDPDRLAADAKKFMDAALING